MTPQFHAPSPMCFENKMCAFESFVYAALGFLALVSETIFKNVTSPLHASLPLPCFAVYHSARVRGSLKLRTQPLRFTPPFFTKTEIKIKSLLFLF